MSSTKRSNKRSVDDFYESPSWVIQILLNNINLKEPMLEPAVGKGKILKLLPKGTVGIDINPEFKPDIISNYLTWDKGKTDYSFYTIITNPPFSYAKEFIIKALNDVEVGGKVCMLLRLNFLESQKRFDLWKEFPPAHIIVLSERPAFTSGGTDSCAYAWFIWKKGYYGMTTISVSSKKETL